MGPRAIRRRRPRRTLGAVGRAGRVGRTENAGHAGRSKGPLGDAGDTLVELLVATLVISIGAVALIGAFASSISASAEHRSFATLDTVLRSFAEDATYAVQLQPVVANPISAPLYSPCAVSYPLIADFPASASAGSTVTLLGTGFSDGRPVSVSVGSSAVPAGDVFAGATTGSTGSVATTFSLPTSGLSLGPTTLTVSEGTYSATVSFTVSSGSLSTSAPLLGYSLSASPPQYWDGSALSFDSACVASANPPQLLSVTARSASGVQDSLAFVVSNPAFVSYAAPSLLSAASASFAAGSPFNFVVQASGSPTPAISASGLPAGVSLTDNHDGTALLSGTASVATGTYIFSIAAANGVSPSASESFTLVVSGLGGITWYSATSGTTCSYANLQAVTCTLSKVGPEGTFSAGVQLVNGLQQPIPNATGAAIAVSETTTGSGSTSSSGSMTIAPGASATPGTYTLTLTKKGPATITATITVNAKTYSVTCTVSG